MPSPSNLPPLIDNRELLRERLRAVPEVPGVYLFRDVAARVIYVGKASQLKNRVSSYFVKQAQRAAHTEQLIARVVDFEVVACLNEREALLLENTLIKRHRPRFNIRLKDDKNYLYLKIPAPGASGVGAPGTARETRRDGRPQNDRASHFPRPYYTRRVARDGAHYFGPYTNAQSLRTTVTSLRSIFPFRTCSDEVFRRGRVCLDYHIRRCCGPCESKVDETAYAHLIDQVSDFMAGDTTSTAHEFERRMEESSEQLDYEGAARYRDRLHALTSLQERQKVIQGVRGDHDCVATAVHTGRGVAVVMSVRGGVVMGAEVHELEGVSDRSSAECLARFVELYYSEAPHLPRAVLLAETIDAIPEISAFLTEQKGAHVDVRVPQRGHLRELVQHAIATAASALEQRRISDDFDAAKTDELLMTLADKLSLPSPPYRIECYDISNTMGQNSVGSMVVFENGRPQVSQYRHFAIKTVEGADDFASIKEVLTRRFARFVAEPNADTGDDIPASDAEGANGGKTRSRKGGQDKDDSFGVLPDLIVIDGGKGQLHSAHDALVAAGLSSIPHFGLAKRNEELYVTGRSEPIILDRDSPPLFLVQRLRDEAHRFAITRHRARRGRAALVSKLDIIPGVGPSRRRALLKHFGSVDAVREATIDELSALSEIPRGVALRIKELL